MCGKRVEVFAASPVECSGAAEDFGGDAGAVSFSVRVLRRHGINANQVFQWRALYREGHLEGGRELDGKLLPVSVSEQAELCQREQALTAPRVGAIHIELPGRALISMEDGVDATLARAVLDYPRR